MTDDPKKVAKRIRKLAREGKVVFAEADRIGRHGELLEEFMEKVFDMKPGDYFVSDECGLFTGFFAFDKDRAQKLEQIRVKIFELYGVRVSTSNPPLLIDVLDEIALTKIARKITCA
mgnify:CR=1 FL=1